MAKISSQSYPTTNKIPMSGGTFQVSGSSVITTAYNDRFASSYNSSNWTKSTSGLAAFTEASDPFHVNAYAPAYSSGLYKLTHKKQILHNGTYVIRHSMKMTFDGFSEKSSYLKFYDGSRFVSIALGHDGANYRITVTRVNSPSGTHTYEYAHGSNTLDIIVECVNRHFTFYKATGAGLEKLERSQQLSHNANYNLEVGVSVSNATSEIEQITYTPLNFQILPCLTGLPVFGTVGIPYSENYREQFASFSVMPSVPGTFETILHGVGAYIGSADGTVDIHVLDVMDRDAETSLVVSPVRALYSDAEPLLACPEYAAEGNNNGGSLSCHARCFCDGTEEDDTAVSMVFDRPGKTNSFSSNQLPGFHFESEGEKYWMNASYDSLPFNLNFFLSGYRVHSIRSLPLKSGKKLYYGTVVPDTTLWENSDPLLFNIRIKVAQLPESASDIDFTVFARLYRQETSSLEPLELVFAQLSTDAPDDGYKVFTTAYPYGCYRLYSSGLRILSVEIKRSTQSDSEYKVIGQQHWAVQSSAVVPGQSLLWNCLYFEIKDTVGRIFSVVHDPCDGTFVKTVESSDSVSLRTDSVSAVELYDGRVAIFYQSYQTIDYTAPGSTQSTKILADSSSAIYYRTINQNSSGFLQLLPGRIVSDQFYGMTCFDIAADESNNIVIVFNREVLIDRDTHHLTHEVTDGLISDSFYSNNTSAEGVKDSPFLERGFRCMTVPMSKIRFNGIALSGETTYISDSSTLILLVTLRELLKTASYDVGSYLGAEFKVSTRAEAGFVRLNYDAVRDTFILALLENRRRIPMIMTGKDTDWREIAIPALKDLDGGPKSTLFNPEVYAAEYSGRGATNPTDPVCFSAYNISADFATDGNIHCFVNQYCNNISNPASTSANLPKTRKGDGALFVIPTDIMQLSRRLLIEKDEDGNYKRSQIFKPTHRQFRFNFLHYYADNIRLTSSVKRDMNYMVNTIGGALAYPMIRVSGYPSQRPSVESDLEVHTPFLRNRFFTNTYEPGSVSHYAMPTTLEVEDVEIVRKLESSDGIGYNLVKQGARFRARISYQTPNYSTVRNDYPIKIKVISVQSSALGVDKYVDACIRISSHEVSFIVSDELFPVTLLTVPLDTRKIYDYFIYIKGTQVTFVIDQLVSDLEVNSLEYNKNLDYRRKNIIVHRGVMPVRAGSKDSKFLVRTENGISGFSYYRVFELGWGFSNFDTDTVFYGGPQNARSVSVRATGLKDLNFKAQETLPDIVYPVKIAGDDMTSSAYHWPNGFSFNFSGVTAKTNDTLLLQRQVVNEFNHAMSKTLYGVWRSVDDTEDVVIWADAHDSDLEKFSVDCFMVRGYNVPTVMLVGRDDEEDPWSDIQTLNLTTYAFPVESYIENEDGQTAFGGFNFPDGKFSLSDYYFRSNGQRAALVKRAAGQSVSLKLRAEEAYSDEGSIFSSKGYKILDRQISYRYIGVRIPSFPTYHGYFTLENFDFGILRSIPLEYNHSQGSGMKFDLQAESYVVNDGQDFYISKRPAKTYEFSYSITDGKTLMKMVSVVDKISMNRSPIWVIDGTNKSIDKFSLCYIDSVSSIEPLVEEDGDSYYKFSISLKSLDGE